MNPCLPRIFPRLPAWRVAEIVGWNAAHPAWVLLRTAGNCVRAGAAVLPLLPAVPAIQPAWAALAPAVYESPSGYGQAGDFGWGTSSGLSADSFHHPGSLTGSGPDQAYAPAWANPVPRNNSGTRPGLPLIQVPGVPFDQPPGDLLLGTQPAVVDTAPVQPVPEPSTLALLGIACIAWGAARLRGWW